MGLGGGTPYKSDGGARQKILRTPTERVSESCFMGMSVADNFLTRLIFIFLFFLGMTMYANEFQTTENRN